MTTGSLAFPPWSSQRNISNSP